MTTLAKVELTTEKRELYASLLILERLINQQSYLTIGKYDDCIDPLLINLDAKDYIKLEDTTYVPTEKGREILSNFMKKYHNFVNVYDVFSTVDLIKGEFAFEQYFDLDDDQWEEHLSNERFQDIRLAVANFKKVDPMEFAVLSFLKEGRFRTDKDGWEFDLTSTLIWDEVEDLVQNSMDISDLSYTDEDGDEITGESVLEDVIKQGSELLINLKKQEAEMDAQAEEEDEYEEEIVEEEVVEYVEIIEEDDCYYDPYYYDPYYDPYYVDPVLVAAIVLF